METEANYSIDMMKKYAFQSELVNIIQVMESESPDRFGEDMVAVKEYFTKRIVEFDKTHKK